MTKIIRVLIPALLVLPLVGAAQQRVSDGTAPAAINSNAVLEMQSASKGMLLPRVALTATTNAAPLSAHVAGMYVYNTATAGSGTTGVTPGNYYNDGTRWWRINNDLTGTGAPTGTAPANTLYTNTTTGDVYTYNGSSWINLSNPPTKVIFGTMGAGIANLPDDLVYRQTGSYITLPPGKWMVTVTMILKKFNAGLTNSTESWWVRTSFADNASSTSITADVLPGSSSKVSGLLPPSSAFGLLTGSVLINNTTGANKTYYYIAGEVTSANPTTSISNFGGTSYTEDIITAVEIQ